ncbi:type II secretion system protein GspC [Pseudoalteromonas sp. MMG012]|uniref:type II secretion system protein GspC n=1 Tax=Pseudoalteromonas sp. MMG012 TaxID=2822686 RepID=UPI001B39F6CB|nr:type II secretion system protein GspC [Pseudoalteromonas sp. MMG012]MBQ4852240.1 type II secretion system protein GspC [Pseudoalteromonas sp. MMG012]
MELQLQQLQKALLGLPHAKLSRMVVLLAVIYIAYLLSQMFWLLWPQPANQPLPSQSALYSSSSNVINTQAITNQHLFGRADAKAQEKPKPVVSDAPETTLNVRLTGIVAVSLDDAAGFAIIESQGKQLTYEVKESIQGTRATLSRVLPDRVILDVSGRFETLMLDGIEYSKNVAMPVAAKSTGKSPNRKKSSQLVASADISSQRDELLKEPGKLFDYIRISRAMKEGQLIGYRLSPGKDPELFRKMGLKNNDLAVAINGYQLTDMKQAMSAMNELRNSSDASITIERDGQTISVQFSL